MPEIEERIAVLETEARHMRATLVEMAHKVNNMHDILMQARGARWVLIGEAALAGFLAGIGGIAIQYLGAK